CCACQCLAAAHASASLLRMPAPYCCVCNASLLGITAPRCSAVPVPCCSAVPAPYCCVCHCFAAARASASLLRMPVPCSHAWTSLVTLLLMAAMFSGASATRGRQTRQVHAP